MQPKAKKPKLSNAEVELAEIKAEAARLKAENEALKAGKSAKSTSSLGSLTKMLSTAAIDAEAKAEKSFAKKLALAKKALAAGKITEEEAAEFETFEAVMEWVRGLSDDIMKE